MAEHSLDNEQLRRVMSLLPIAVYTCDAAGRITFFNRRAAELCGDEPNGNEEEQTFSPSYELLLPDRAFIPPDQMPMALALAEGKSFRNLEVSFERRNGEHFTASLSIDPIRDAHGRICGVITVFDDISDHKRAQEAQRQTEERFRLAACSDAITLYEQDSKLRYIWLYPIHPEHQTALGKTDAEILGNAEGGLLSEWKQQVMATGTNQRREIQTTLTNGTRVYDLFISPRRNRTGDIVGVAGAALDITDTKRSDTASRELAAIVESSDDAIFAKDLNGIIKSWNRGAERLFYYTADEVIGKSITMLIPPDRQDEEPRILQRLRRGERIDHFETIRMRKDKSLVPISLTVSPIRDASGKVVGASKIARDISERRRNEQQQRAIYELVARINRAEGLPQVFEAALDAICRSQNADRAAILLYDSDQVMRFKAWRSLSDDYRRAVEGHSPWQPDDPAPQPVCIDNVAEVALEQHLRAVIEREGIRALAFIPITCEGRLLGKFMVYYNEPHRFSAEEIRPTQTVAIQVAFGIERQKTGEALERLVSARTASLREAVQQMEEFSYTVSHDLRAPLRGMQGYSQALLEDFSDILPPEAKVYLNRLADNATRLDKMILDVLTFTRIARAEVPLERICLDKLVRELVEHYQDMQPPRAELHIEPLLDVIGHEPSLVQAISNLLTNAVKFVAPAVRPKLRVWTERKGPEVRLWIEDNGIGIDPKYRHRLFSMFERIHPDLKYDGTGVGLAIVRKAVERMGGTVGMESSDVKGSRFWIQLRAASVDQ